MREVGRECCLLQLAACAVLVLLLLLPLLLLLLHNMSYKLSHQWELYAVELGCCMERGSCVYHNVGCGSSSALAGCCWQDCWQRQECKLPARATNRILQE